MDSTLRTRSGLHCPTTAAEEPTVAAVHGQNWATSSDLSSRNDQCPTNTVPALSLTMFFKSGSDVSVARGLCLLGPFGVESCLELGLFATCDSSWRMRCHSSFNWLLVSPSTSILAEVVEKSHNENLLKHQRVVLNIEGHDIRV